MWTRYVIVLALVLPMAVVRAQQEPPNPPESCANEHGTDPSHACACHQMCDPLDKEKSGGDDPMCKTFCKPSHCHCKAMCPDT